MNTIWKSTALFRLIGCCPREVEVDLSSLPGPDVFDVLKREGRDWWAFQSGRPLKDFDAIVFILDNEIDLLGVNPVLSASGIPPRTHLRTETAPIIIGCGNACLNPAPLSGIIDLYLLGWPESHMLSLSNALSERKKGKISREAFFSMLAERDGVYVPSHRRKNGVVVPRYDRAEMFRPEVGPISYSEPLGHQFESIVCLGTGETDGFVPYGGALSPDSDEDMLREVDTAFAQGGYDRWALRSPYDRDGGDLCRKLVKLGGVAQRERAVCHIPDVFGLPLGNVGFEKYPSERTVWNMTLWGFPFYHPRTGFLAGEDVDGFIRRMWSVGARNIHLRLVMSMPDGEKSLPGWAALGSLLERSMRNYRDMKLAVSCEPSGTAPHTIFQWDPFMSPSGFQQLKKCFQKNYGGGVRGNSWETALLQSYLGRLDERLTDLFCSWGNDYYWKEGDRDDSGSLVGRWLESVRQKGVDVDSEVTRVRLPEEAFPWDLVFNGSDKTTLLRRREEYRKGGIPPARVVEPAAVRASSHVAVPRRKQAPRVVWRVRCRFARDGAMRFLSHLEQIELLRRTFRRLHWPIATGGKQETMNVSFGPAISVGYSSEAEYADLELYQRMECEGMKEELHRCLPPGFRVLSVHRIPLHFPSLEEILNVAGYSVEREEYLRGATRETVLDQFKKNPHVRVTKKKKEKEESIDVGDLLKEFEWDDQKIRMVLRFGPGRTLRPEHILKTVLSLTDDQTRSLKIHRQALFSEQADGQLWEP
ncbi:MAG TPA: TIGR03936 family radical SAM-associated protein [Elusimicrobiota bacterium]|nr:TIGR03936 family radical SAM-associated protein [Elusimicrobiota bacterium]